MKKIILLSILLLAGAAYSQQKVGINTSTPQATLDILGKGNNSTPIFRIGSSGSNSYFRIMPVLSYVISGNGNNGSYPLSIYPLDDTHADLAVQDAADSKIFIKHYNDYKSANNNSELKSYGIDRPDILSGHIIVFSSGGNNSGFYMGPVSDVPGGIYIGENGNNGLGLISVPTEKLDVGGALRVAATAGGGSIAEGAACTRPGEIAFSGGFWGCTAAGWKKMD